LSNETYANLKSFEGQLIGSHVELDFPWRAKELVIINDEDSGDLKFRFDASAEDNWATLKAGETVRFERLMCKRLHLSAVTMVNYRIWGVG